MFHHLKRVFFSCSCGVNNFASRDACFKCSAPRPEGMGPPKRTPRPGDWDCPR